MLKRTFALVTLLVWLPCAEAAITLSSAQVTTTAQYTRLILDSNEPITHATTNQTEQLVIDLNEVKNNAALKNIARKISADDPYLKHLRITYLDNIARLTFDLKIPVKVQTLTMEPMKPSRYRLVFELSSSKLLTTPTTQKAGQRPDMGILINLSAGESATPPSPAAPTTKANRSMNKRISSAEIATPADIEIPPTRAREANPRTTSSKITFYNTEQAQIPQQSRPTYQNRTLNRRYAPIERAYEPRQDQPPVQIASPTPKSPFVASQEENTFALSIENNSSWQDGRRMLIVAIDAGHGGQDPGALGHYGSYEKTITLAIARQVKNILANTPNLRGVLTRQGDIYIPLVERVERAHRSNADLFISIHADSFINASAQGSSVYTLSKHGASSSAADWLAKKENSADAIGGVMMDNNDATLRRTLFDLSQTAAVKDSQHLASHILQELSNVNELHRGKVEKAGFAVLKSPHIPSILIETAFISNPAEENRLNDMGYQARIAAAIVKGIQHYFAQNPALSGRKMAQNN